MRVDVDFNERDRQGHVVARVPGDQAARLMVGQRVYLYDPPERLWAEAVVSRISPDTRIAAFDVDWRSFEDAEVADFRDGHGEWLVGLPPGESHWPQSSVFAATASGFAAFTISGDIHWQGAVHVVVFGWGGGGKSAVGILGAQVPAVLR